jgi:hypothetical protein
MTILEDAETKQRCDERCYNAKGLFCDCLCGGKNHGNGLDAALKNLTPTGEKEDDDGK